MTLEITEADIYVAKQRAKDSRDHCWHHPIAVAIERIRPDCKAAISRDRLHIAAASGIGAILQPSDGETIRFLHEWRYDRARAASVSFGGATFFL